MVQLSHLYMTSEKIIALNDLGYSYSPDEMTYIYYLKSQNSIAAFGRVIITLYFFLPEGLGSPL